MLFILQQLSLKQQSLIIFLMCEHTRRPKLFCVLQSCQRSECCACSICMKQFHNHNFESYLSQKDVTELLARFQQPNSLKEARKQINLKLYKFLTRLKNEVTSKLDSIFGDLMSKVKYPFLYKSELLDSYRNIRDKNYQRLVPEKFRLFCRRAKTLEQGEIFARQEQYYAQYLKQINRFLGDVPRKVASIQQAFEFTLHPEVLQIYADYIKEIQSHQIVINPNQKSKSSISHYKPNNIVYSPNKLGKNKKDFLTPTKLINKNDVSLDNLSLQAISDNQQSSKKSEALEEQINLNASLELSMQRAKTSKTPQKIGQTDAIKPFETESIKSQDENIKNSTNQSRICYNSTFSYEEGRSKGFSIKISDAKIQKINQEGFFNQSQNPSLCKSTQFNEETKKKIDENYRKKSFNQSMNYYIKEREQNIKKRLDQLKLEKNSAQEKKSNSKSSEQNNKNLSGNKAIITAPQNPSSPTKCPLESPPKIHKKAQQFHYFTQKKQKKPISRQVQVADTKNESKNCSMLHVNQKRNLSPSKRSSNISLNKHFIHKQKQLDKSHEQIHNNLGSITKQIPVVEPVNTSPKRKLLQRKNSLQTTVEEQLEASCILLAKLQQITNKQELAIFLQKFIEKYENSITGVQYLTYIYLQLGKAKEALLLASSYLEKLESLNVKESYKANLIINKAAALNILGRQKQTIAFLTSKLSLLEHFKIHKNLGDAYFHLGDKDNAIYHYEKATQLNSKYDEAYYNLAVMLYLQESYFNALMNIEKAVNIQSQNVTYTELKAAIKERISNSRAQ